MASQIQRVEIRDVEGLAPITVFLEDVREGVGAITIICRDRAWQASWGGMGEQKVSEFVAACRAQYLLDKLNPQLEGASRAKLRENLYLARIVNAVKRRLAQPVQP